ncbi:hypothetical protein B0H13DRAFT_2356586 [Mycena leptocephala]|nr:hypothetical protein B0H13DRAFT_2356586 [Mycena leptocephala]
MAPTKAELVAKLKALKAGKKNTSKANKENKRPKEKHPKKPRKAPSVRWAKTEFFYLTDELVSIIEESNLYRQSFGFTKITPGPVPTGGKTQPDLQAEIAESMFITPPDATYTKDDLVVLTTAVGNRISALKKGYRDSRTLLGATGQGLVAENREGEIESGSDLQNLWGTVLYFAVSDSAYRYERTDKIQKKFPWYKRMHLLMGNSPVVDRSAVSHSQTSVDLAILDTKPNTRKAKKSKHTDSDSDEDDDSSDVISGWDKTDEEDILSISSHSSPLRPSTPKTPAPRVKAEPSQASAARGTKRKSVHDQVEALATQDRVQRLKVAEVREREKTARAKHKYDTKSELELAKLQHQQMEAERQRQHEFAMLERQIQLERLRQQAGPSTYGPPGGPAFGAPPPASAFDPQLF